MDKRVELEKVRIGLEQALSSFLMDSAVSYEEYSGILNDHVVYRMRGFLLGEKIASQTIKYPRDWWQAFKDAYFSDWLKGLFPVKFTSVTVTTKAVYPDFRPSLPNQRYISMLEIDKDVY